MKQLFKSSGELQLEKDASSRYLPIVIATMVFLASLALIGLYTLNSAVTQWSASVTGNLTVEIAYVEDENLDDKLQKTAVFLESVPGIAKVTPLSTNEVAELLAPYLGNSEFIKQLPLPRLIEIEVAENSSLDILALAKQLSSSFTDVVLNTHRPWLDKMILLARSVQLLAASIMLLIGIVTIIIIVFAARTGMVMHQEIIEVLHLIGAKDSYVASQFQNYFAKLSLIGAVPGLIIAFIVMQSLTFLADRMDAALISGLTLDLEGWVILLLIPIFVVLLTAVTVRMIVIGSLKRMM